MAPHVAGSNPVSSQVWRDLRRCEIRSLKCRDNAERCLWRPDGVEGASFMRGLSSPLIKKVPSTLGTVNRAHFVAILICLFSFIHVVLKIVSRSILTEQ